MTATTTSRVKQIDFLECRVANLQDRLDDARDFGLRPDDLEAKLEDAQEELAVLEMEQREEELQELRGMGHRHGLCAREPDRSREDLEHQDAEEQEETEAYLAGFAEGEDLGDTFPVARLEALQCLIKEWKAQGDDHPNKLGAIERLSQDLQMVTATLPREYVAA